MWGHQCWCHLVVVAWWFGKREGIMGTDRTGLGGVRR
jgi:hypothetical protein